MYLISPDYIKTNYSGMIDSNVDDSILKTFIIISQRDSIQDMLGYNLYKKYVDDITNSTPITGYYRTLLQDFIEPALALWTIYNAYPNINFRATNKALSKKSSDSSVNSEVNEVEYVRSSIRNMAERASKDIREYIVNNETQFPEYTTITGVERIHPKSDIYFSGLFLPDSYAVKRICPPGSCDCD